MALWRGGDGELAAFIYLLIKYGKFIIQLKKAINVALSKLNAHLISTQNKIKWSNGYHILRYVELFSKSLISCKNYTHGKNFANNTEL